MTTPTSPSRSKSSLFIRPWLMRALFFISFLEYTQASSWPPQTQQPLLLDPPLQFYSPPPFFPIIGIHLGPDLIRVAVVHNKTISLIPFEHGTLSMPNIVSFVSDPPLVGHEVTKTNATHNIYGIERLIGRSFADPIVQEVVKEAEFKIIDVGGEVRVEMEKEWRGKKYLARISPEEVMGILLGRVKKFAGEFLGDVREAVVAVPADWDDAQRAAVEEAGKIAGLEIVRITNEPDMAVTGYSYFKWHLTCGPSLLPKILVYNIGSHTFSASVLVYEQSGLETVATVTDSHLGGTDFDDSRFEYTMKLVEQALEESNMDKSSIDAILLVGESTVGVSLMLEKYFSKAPFEGVDPEIAIAHGAAIRADVITWSDDHGGCMGLPMDVYPYTLGIETTGGLLWPIAFSGTSLTNKNSQIFTTAVDYQTSVLIQVYEGESQQTNHTRLRGEIELKGIVPAKKGVAQIQVMVEFTYHHFSKVKVTARYMENERSVEFGLGFMSDEHLDQRMEDGDLYMKDVVGMKNEIDSDAYNGRTTGVMDLY